MSDPCAECGMPVEKHEYHPYAACLMFKGCHNSALVRVNLDNICAYALQYLSGDAQQQSKNDE